MDEVKDNTIVFPYKFKEEPKAAVTPEEASKALEAAAEEGRKQAAMDSTMQHVDGPTVAAGDLSAAPMQPRPEEHETQTVKINPKAIITWYDAEGKVTTQETAFRSFPVLADQLEATLDVGRKEDDKVAIHLQLIDCFIKPQPGDPDQKPRTTLTIKSGKLGDVIEYMRTKTVSPQAVLMQLQAMIYSLADVSTLKGVIISVVMADARAAGFGFLSESIEVTDQDIQVLAAASSAQVDMFKTKMKEKRKVEFPDESPIVAASQGELLKLTNGRGVKG